mmetsp:Transcript_39245/g.100304  ORF Transcript_39245/g.100304 Transcript_39245/m.100304 type:complete len:91 (+) Transcript_39245:796-1068(+)
MSCVLTPGLAQIGLASVCVDGKAASCLLCQRMPQKLSSLGIQAVSEWALTATNYVGAHKCPTRKHKEHERHEVAEMSHALGKSHEGLGDV